MGAYLRDYESQLSSVVADEVFNQRVVATRAYTSGLPQTETLRRRLSVRVVRRRLDSNEHALSVRQIRRDWTPERYCAIRAARN